MRKLIFFLYVCLVFILSTLTLNCKKDSSNNSDNPPVIPPRPDSVLNKNVRVIDSTKLILNSDSALLSVGKYEYTFTGTAPELKVNDVIVGATNGGYIRKISSLNTQSNKIILGTTQGSMEDVFQNAGFNFKTGIDSLMHARLMSGYHFDVSGETLYQDGSITIKLDKGLIDVNGDWNFGFNFKNARLDTFEISCKNASFNGEFDLNISASQAITIAERTSALARVAKYNTFLAGGVPVVLYTEVELRCVFSAAIDASAHGNVIINTKNTANAGVKYQNSQWQNTYNNNSNSSITVTKAVNNVNAQIKMAIVPYVSFRLYRVLGPYFSLGLKELIKASLTTPSLDWDFSAAAWLQAIIGVKADIIGSSLFDFSKEWNTDTLFFQTPFKIEKTSGDNQTGVAGQYLNQPLKVRILNSNGNAQSKVPVKFEVSAGGGSVQNRNVLTNDDGYAETLWKLGSEFGIQTVSVITKKADGTNLQNSPIEFAATISQNVPALTTTSINTITQTTVISGGNITNDGGSPITARGVCWSTTANPTIAGNKTTDGTGAGSFTSNISGLVANTTYHLRAYATNNSGTAYGNEVIFLTQQLTGFLTDIDGNVYSTIQIGTQIWMKENLRTTRYKNGTPIPLITDNLLWNQDISGAYCNYDNSEGNAIIYGRLYNWRSVTNTAGICPVGWHVPTQDDFQKLYDFVGNLAGPLKDTILWNSPNSGATNNSGFSALPGGHRYGDGGSFYALGYSGTIWSSSVRASDGGRLGCGLYYNFISISIGPYLEKGGLSCRCIKDQ